MVIWWYVCVPQLVCVCVCLRAERESSFTYPLRNPTYVHYRCFTSSLRGYGLCSRTLPTRVVRWKCLPPRAKRAARKSERRGKGEW